MGKIVGDKLLAWLTMVAGLAFILVAPSTGVNTDIGLVVTVGGLATLIGSHMLSSIASVVQNDFLGKSSEKSLPVNTPSATKSL